jgi:hypothetical protein
LRIRRQVHQLVLDMALVVRGDEINRSTLPAVR